MTLPEGPLAAALRRGRDRHNARVAYARRVYRGFDTGALAEQVRACEPVVAAAVAAGGDADAVTTALFDAAVDLVGRRLIGPGARSVAVGLAWEVLLPAVASQLAADPRGVLAALSNAALRLPEPRLDAWMAALAAVAPLCDARTLLAAGQVLAWRCGVARYRRTALAVWADLPEPIARRVLDLPDGLARSAAAAALVDPWWRPGATPVLRIVARVGGHVGLGGVFVEPPTVGVHDGGLYAWDRERCFLVHADAWGTDLTRAPALPAARAGSGLPPLSLSRAGRVTAAAGTAEIPGLAESKSWASNAHTLAVSFARSHHVFLVAAA